MGARAVGCTVWPASKSVATPKLTTCLHTIVPLAAEARDLVKLIAADRETDALADEEPVAEMRAQLGRLGLLETEAVSKVFAEPRDSRYLRTTSTIAFG